MPIPHVVHRARPGGWVPFPIKILILGVLDATVIGFGTALASQQAYGLLACAALGALALNWVFLSERAYPLRYLLPGVFFMTVMVVYPLFYNVYISFTNYGTGNLLTKQMVIDRFKSETYVPEDAPKYPFALFADDQANLRVLVQAPDGTRYITQGPDISQSQTLAPVSSAPEAVDEDGDGEIDRVGEAVRLNRFQALRHLSALEEVELDLEGEKLRLASANHFQALERRYVYDPKADALTDRTTGTVYTARDGFFTSEAGERLVPGYRVTVGFKNYARLLTNPSVSGPFVRVFLWTVVWAASSVLLTFALGLGLALLLNDPNLRFKGLYRSLLIIPYAIPSFVSALVWRGLFNTEFGQVNRVIEMLFDAKIPWLQDPFWAKAALLIVNLWFGFPYMMIVTLGALQSISPELYEAAYCDGARGWQRFRFITLPLLLTSIAPLLIASFAFNFNNFNIIYLVTKGRPPIAGAATPAGATDILISYTYRLAFESGRGADYGLAAAVSVLIFLIIGTITWFNFRFTKSLEETSENV